MQAQVEAETEELASKVEQVKKEKKVSTQANGTGLSYMCIIWATALLFTTNAPHTCLRLLICPLFCVSPDLQRCGIHHSLMYIPYCDQTC